MTEEYPPDRPGDEPDGEGTERRQQADKWRQSLVEEDGRENQRCRSSVQKEVVPLDARARERCECYTYA
jgi:hypothetical protein